MVLEEVIGRHRIRLEPPDLFAIVNDGDISEADASRLMNRLVDFAGGKERVLLLIDVERSGQMAPAARSIVVNCVGRLPVAGIAIVGATFSTRVAATLMTKALGLLYPSATVTRFFASEAEARAWLGERRQAAGATT